MILPLIINYIIKCSIKQKKIYKTELCTSLYSEFWMYKVTKINFTLLQTYIDNIILKSLCPTLSYYYCKGKIVNYLNNLSIEPFTIIDLIRNSAKVDNYQLHNIHTINSYNYDCRIIIYQFIFFVKCKDNQNNIIKRILP